jgi:hypothetical protein
LTIHGARWEGLQLGDVLSFSNKLKEARESYLEVPACYVGDLAFAEDSEKVDVTGRGKCEICLGSLVYQSKCFRCNSLMCNACSKKRGIFQEDSKHVYKKCCDGCFNLLRYRYGTEMTSPPRSFKESLSSKGADKLSSSVLKFLKNDRDEKKS